MTERKFDIIVWGATGFTGTLVTEYLSENYGVNQEISWAIAGRSPEKCQQIKQELIKKNSQAIDLEIIIADAFSLPRLREMAKQTQVICTTVGPYSDFGEQLVQACIDEETQYCDLTGESHFIRAMIDTHQVAAEEKKIKIVHAAGFDSIPSDMGVYFTQEKFREKHGVYATEIKMMTGKMRGKFSGGTIASMISLLNRVQKDKSLRRLLLNPYALNPDPKYQGKDKNDQLTLRFDKELQRWTAPFIMAGINTRVVRRSHALRDFPYGSDFQYSEVMGFPKGLKGFWMASSLTLGLGGFMGLVANSWMRNKLHQYLLPQPGDGPSREEQQKGYFNIHFRACHGEKELWTRVSDSLDPGYACTAKMLGETAVALAKDAPILPKQYGVLTPVSALGQRLIERLSDAKMKFSVDSE